MPQHTHTCRWAVATSVAVLASLVPLAAQAGPNLVVQMVVGDPSSLTSGDTALKSLLEDDSYDVTLIDDSAAVTAADGLTDLIVIAPSTSGSVLGSKYGDVGVAQLVLASTAWDSMGLTEEDGIFADSTSLSWVDASNPIAQWLPSPVQVVPTAKPMRSMVAGNLADGATPVAVRLNNTTQNVVFTFGSGDELTTGAAPAPRAVVGFSDPALANLTADGNQLLINAATWATQGAAPLSLSLATATGATTFCDKPEAPANQVVCYEMNDTNTTMTDSASPASNVSNATATSLGVKRQKRNGFFAEYFFNGWKGYTIPATDLQKMGQLTATKPTLPSTTYSGIVVDKSYKPPAAPPAESLNPGTGPWQITTRVMPYVVKVVEGSNEKLRIADPATDCPDSACMLDTPSYNIVQKGRSNASGGYYKLEVMGHASSGGQYSKGSVHCVFKDGSGNTLEAYSGGSATPTNARTRLDSKRYFNITCQRIGNTLTLSVLKEGNVLTDTVTVTGSLGSVSPSNDEEATPTTGYSQQFSIGKKPGSDHVEDAFSGWMDYLVVSVPA